ncbi:hypothetical protein evm_003798 [Chilo suppressalis]|nr:hypothetical protein evm_003798 [Chilo suppressalis]
MMQPAELKCMDPENYRKFFRALCWSYTKKVERKTQRKLSKKEKLRRLKASSALPTCYAPAILCNPSQFAVYATVRRLVLARWMHLPGSIADFSEDSDDDDANALVPMNKLPKVTGIGLRTVFALISQARFTDSEFCENALKALLDVLQGHTPEELAQEPTEIISNLHAMLIEVASGSGPGGRSETPTELTSLSGSCLVALSVARGETELILNAVASLIMSAPALSDQSIQIPSNLTTLQRSVQSIMLGTPSRNLWLNYGVPHQSLVTSFPVDLPPQLTSGPGELVVRSLVSDGCYLYVYTSKGLLKIGSGYGSSIKQHVYMHKPDFFASDRHGWLGYCKNKLYVRIGRKKTEVYEIDKETLEVRGLVRLEPGQPAPIEPKSAVFTDGNQLGLIMLTNFDNITIKMYDVDSPKERVEMNNSVTLTSHKYLNVHLLRRRTLVLGRAPFDDNLSRRAVESDAPVAMQLEDNEEDPLSSICTGQDFGLLITNSGKVYYTGKGASLGYKSAAPHSGRWTLMKETLFIKNEAPNTKKCKVVQIAVGHEGMHAVMVLDNGSALFTGVARRGEDGDTSKHRRTPKATRPKKIFKAEGHHVTYAACNHGSTALVTRQGLLLMFGKDSQHCDSNGIVQGLRHERVIQVALGKAHTVVLTNFGQVYTFGINNKGQCGREFGYTKEKMHSSRRHSSSSTREDVQLCSGAHAWNTDYCRVCVLCRECTGFASACHCASMPGRLPGEKCGCGEGDSGCSVCGICRRCADTFAAAGRERVTDLDEDTDASTKSDTRPEREGVRFTQREGSPLHAAGSEAERDASIKVSSLPPARVAVPGGHRVVAVACGLHHTVLLTEHGEVLTFGSNQYGQLGAGDISPHHRIVRVRVPRASSVAAGSHHTAVLTREGELYTFGCYQKGSLGRPRIDEPSRNERSPVWYATPGRVPRLGPRYSCKAVWVTASGDQTFMQLSQSLIKTDTLFSATVTANGNSIVILPNRPEHTFKCITINKADGTCNAWSGSEQVDFVNTLACLDPLYDVLWCYQPQMRVMKCYNILAFDSHKQHRCCNNEPESFPSDNEFEYPNYGSMKRLDEFKNLQVLETTILYDDKPPENVALSNMSVLNQELAIPSTPGCTVTRMHAALHLLGCLDSLTYAHDTKLNQVECKRESASSPVPPVKEDYLTVNRFENHGGGWGYSGHSVEAIRFMCDTDILLGGFALFGGRGDYTAKIKLFDIGCEGGDQEGDGELMAESEEVMFECAPRDRFPILFEAPLPLVANRWYVAWACINGPSSDCGSSGQAMVINDDIGFHFKTSKKSNNGTDVNAGQIPCLLYNLMNPDHSIPIKRIEPGDPVIVLSKNISRMVTVSCFHSLITLLQWSWTTFKEVILETNGQIPINYQKLTVMKHQKRLVYVIRACLRLVKSYINEIYPQNNKKRNSHEYMSYFEAIADIRNLIQLIMADKTPSCNMLPRRGKNKTHRVCYVQFALEMTNAILKEAHNTITACFHAFFPTPSLKWNHLCSLLFHVKDGVVPASQVRELTSTCAAMCASRSLRDVLQFIVPVTQSAMNEYKKPESKITKEVPSKSATVPRSSNKPPPIPPRSNNKEAQKQPDPTETKSSHTEWHLLDVIPKLLDVVTIPIKKQMMTRQCGQPHDHGEIKQAERLAEYCCKLVSRIVAELTYSATNVRDLDTNLVKHQITPSRFMRVNQSRAWHTGNGSPDAVCFTVDRPGVMLVGVCAYGGLGHYEYTLELLQDLRLRATAEETDPGHCWVSVEVTQGTFCTADCQHDMVQLKFERPVALKEDLRYAIRLCNHGGRTANGDCGLPSVKGPDGTTFRFASCSLSINGTSMARGQIPCFIYYGSTLPQNSSESADTLITELRGITLRVGSMVVDRCAELFCTLRNELTTEDLRRNAAVLQQSACVSALVPYTIAHLSELDDSKSMITLLEMVNTLMPHVAAMNLLMPTAEEPMPSTTGQYYTWVESDHPYKQATVSNVRVLFPPNVAWVVIEMDRRCITAQPEDTLTVYASVGPPRRRCHCANEARLMDPPFRKRLVQLSSESGEAEELCDDESDTACMHYNCTYFSVTPKLSNNAADWPPPAFIVPGNEVIFSLETASDYLNEYNKTNSEDNRFGYRCLCVGYEDSPFTTQKQGLVALEMELVYAAAGCASRLLAPDLEIPSLTFTTVVEVQLLSMMGANLSGADLEPTQTPAGAQLLARGLELSSPPTIHQVLDGHPLIRSVSTERQFLSDFVAANENSAGGRLARWLSPSPFVEPGNCELVAPTTPAYPTSRVNLPVVIRDQYGEPVVAPALKVEVVVQRIEDVSTRSVQPQDGVYCSLPNVPYQPTFRDNMCFHAITMMKAYQHLSFEELRLASGSWGDRAEADGFTTSGRVPAERLPVRAQPDGTYLATWTPRAPGSYLFRCTLDDHPAPTDVAVAVEMTSDPLEQTAHRGPQTGVALTAPASKVRRFCARHSAGLRVRASPSLQAEEVGRVPLAANLAYVEEVVNKDGTWVRLSEESVRAYTDNYTEVAWCLQHNRHFDRALLVPVEQYTSPLQPEYTGVWSGYGDAQGDMQSWTQEDDIDIVTSEIARLDLRSRYPSGSQTDLINESEAASLPYAYGLEPSKRSRIMRSESTSMPTPRRVRRSNGNSEEVWTPVKHRSSDNVRDSNTILETEVESEKGARLAQAGTQTSPEDDSTAIHLYLNSKEARQSPRNTVRDRLARRARPPYKRASSPPPLPARVAPPPPRKLALSPAQAECLRAIFAALLWHEGIVHDAIACAAFLKFHPQLPKQGARVVTRAPSDHSVRLQRHSVEVSNAGQYLSIHPSTLETLTRSGEEASANRVRKSEVDAHAPINEEDSTEESTPSVVNVLPPALRALVALWDALCEAKQLNITTDKTKKEEGKDEEDPRPIIKVRQKKVWRSISKTPYSVQHVGYDCPVNCELCGGSGVPPPLAAHMRHVHPGCRTPTARGYDRSGVYRRADVAAPADAAVAACGQLAQASQLWYTFCEKCRDKALKAVSSVKVKTKTISDVCYERAPAVPEIDHHIIRENAVFLLDLAPLTNSESLGRVSPIHEGQARSPPTPPGSLWQPAPPFQCLPALGLAPKSNGPPDTTRYHSLGRPPPLPAAMESTGTEQVRDLPPRVQRSISMGQTGARDLATAARKNNAPLAPVDFQLAEDSLSGVGSSLLSQPSEALRKLVGCGESAGAVSAFEAPHVSADALMRRPVLAFVLSRRDLHAYTQKLDGAVRINTVRQYAFEALNWLLRSTTQPTGVHDVMWWFCSALDKYTRTVPSPPPLDDNKEASANDNNRLASTFPAASSICPGGNALRGARTAFHAFLGSVSTLAPSLPPASAAGLQAIRCWALHYSPYDRAFLHRSQVFSVISKVLSHPEDDAYDETLLGALHESFHSYSNKENYVWSCPDVTSWCDITVSSRQGMAGALTDGSTETFWESGDEDRNKARWVEITYPGGTTEDRPHIICVHLDNTRDTVNKTMLASFLYSGGTGEPTHMQDIEVDPKTASWLCYTLPRLSSSCVRVRCELRGAEPAVRVRQVRVLAAPGPVLGGAAAPTRVLHGVSEADALRVFRLLTSQVFGKLLEWERSSIDSGEGPVAVDDAATNDTDLREHVVGILFAGHKLTSLQRQVMSHIVYAIGHEAARVRDDWETVLLCAEAAERHDETLRPTVNAHAQDNYCFEMLSLLLALSGSAVGCAHLAQRTELLADLLALLHTGSERVQRQVISLLRRMISEIKPQKALIAINYGNNLSTRVTLLDHLVSYLGKAITVQVKVKGAGGATPSTVVMGSSVVPTPPAAWFMRGETIKKHAHLVAKLLSDMAEDKVSASWGQETRSALALYVSQIAQVAEHDRRPARCIAAPAMWMTLAALCVCSQDHLELINGSGEGRESRRDLEARPFCSNHDDGATAAVIECRTCGPLCGECDRFLHLKRVAKTHQRQICKEEESAIRVDIHEGCGRAKLFWLLLLVDRRTLKALAEFRGMDAIEEAAVGETGFAGTCRFCCARGSTGLLAIGNVCADQQCQEHGREACNRVLGCGHMCGGVRCEPQCLPCLFGCGRDVPLRQDADYMCMICFTDPLQAAPAIQLSCGHVFHLHCCKKVLANKWIGPRITFSFSQCPICKEDMNHWTLEDLLDPIRRLRDEVRRKALMRLEYEGVSVPGAPRGRPGLDPATYAMDRYAYYVCHKCERVYFGGLARCEAETSGWWEPTELVCGACSDVAGARTCPKHGADFLEYKCRYCCSVAVFFCFGTSHFCNACHDDFQRVTNIPKHLLPQCPAGPKGEQLPGSAEECPLHVQHPPTGEEFALGCGICRHSQGF